MSAKHSVVHTFCDDLNRRTTLKPLPSVLLIPKLGMIKHIQLLDTGKTLFRALFPVQYVRDSGNLSKFSHRNVGLLIEKFDMR